MGMRGTEELEPADTDLDPGSPSQELCDSEQVTWLLWASVALLQQGKRKNATLTGCGGTDLTLPV